MQMLLQQQYPGVFAESSGLPPRGGTRHSLIAWFSASFPAYVQVSF